METNEEGKPQFHEDALLTLRVLDFVALYDGLLVQDFHGEDTASLLVTNEEDLGGK